MTASKIMVVRRLSRRFAVFKINYRRRRLQVVTASSGREAVEKLAPRGRFNFDGRGNGRWRWL